MSATVRIPPNLRFATGGVTEVSADPGTVGSVLAELENAYSGITSDLFDSNGGLSRFVNVYVADEDVRFIGGLEARVQSGDAMAIIPALSGG